MRALEAKSRRGVRIAAVLLGAICATLITYPVVATSSVAAVGCASRSNAYGEMTVCPDAGPVGTLVAISGRRCNNPGVPVDAVFLGPTAYIGSAGGGVSFEIPEGANGRFNGGFRIPATYRGGGDFGGQLPVIPGSGYQFSAYPAALCAVPFVVTAGVPLTGSRNDLWAPGVSLVAGGLLAIGVGLTRPRVPLDSEVVGRRRLRFR